MAPFYSQTNYLEIKRHTYTIGDIGNGTREVGEQTNQKAGNHCRKICKRSNLKSKQYYLRPESYLRYLKRYETISLFWSNRCFSE